MSWTASRPVGLGRRLCFGGDSHDSHPIPASGPAEQANPFERAAPPAAGTGDERPSRKGRCDIALADAANGQSLTGSFARTMATGGSRTASSQRQHAAVSQEGSPRESTGNEFGYELTRSRKAAITRRFWFRTGCQPSTDKYVRRPRARSIANGR